MRRLILWDLITLDGFFEGKEPWDLEFHKFAWGPELEAFIVDQTRTIGTVLFGRVTYEGMASYWPGQTGPVARVMNSVPKVVFSRTLTEAKWNNARVVRGNLLEEVRRLKSEPGNDLFVLGSGLVSTQLAAADLIDEYRFGVVSLILGSGHPLFGTNRLRVPLRVVEGNQLGPRCTFLRCEPVRPASAERTRPPPGSEAPRP
jgi:dihydrofolate reductase